MVLFRSTSCCLLNGFNQSFSSLEFDVTWFRGIINIAAEELKTAEFDCRFDSTSQLINLYETFPCLYDVRSKDHKNRDMIDKARVEIAAKLGRASE